MAAWEQTLTVDVSVDAVSRSSGSGSWFSNDPVGEAASQFIPRIVEVHRGVRPGTMEEFAVLRALEVAIERGDRFEAVAFAWVPRRKNQIAHALARHAVRNGAARASEIEALQPNCPGSALQN